MMYYGCGFCKKNKVGLQSVDLCLKERPWQPAFKDCFVIVLVLVALNCLKYVDFFVIPLLKFTYELLVNNNILKRYLLLK